MNWTFKFGRAEISYQGEEAYKILTVNVLKMYCALKMNLAVSLLNKAREKIDNLSIKTCKLHTRSFLSILLYIFTYSGTIILQELSDSPLNLAGTFLCLGIPFYSKRRQPNKYGGCFSSTRFYVVLYDVNLRQMTYR